MKLYMHPVSTTSRPVMHFIAENGIACDQQVVDILKGEQYGEAYSKVNPNHMVPLLDDDGFQLSESATILRYLAEKSGSAAYPKDLRKRARVDEMLDWLNSNFYRDWGYGLIYPQVFPHLKRADPTVQAAVVAYGKERSQAWLQILNDSWIGARPYLCGNELSIADYFGAALVSVGEVVQCDFKGYPNVARWLGTMKQRPAYGKIYEVFNGFVQSVKEQKFEHV